MMRDSCKTLQVGAMGLNSIPEEQKTEDELAMYDEDEGLSMQMEMVSLDRTINAHTDLRYYKE